MRTTVRMDPELLRRLKEHAARQGLSLTRVLEDAAWLLLARRPGPAAVRERIRLPTYAGRGLQPGVDLDDSAALLDLMERGDAAD
jgi:hypothetical protein